MHQDPPTAVHRVVWLMKVLWAVLIITTTTAIGAYSGWVGHGIVGALALGFVGFVAGCFVWRPSMIMQLLT
ncbi:hypothetical protein SAMN03159448_04615 [Sinorhizobium sp. NFACC03]|nr:hypothetical protein SAMN03159448_04615 [Sinorhizobium sp. NFACC03]